jgi:chromate reductase, NAD(P)H dehydrogenase (quinone)
MPRILAISGSLRRASSNTALLEAMAQLASDGLEVDIYRGLADLPPFNPDLDGDVPQPAVDAFRAELARADAVLISSPEYAHGVPGVLKNALDWVVGSGELIDKPVALINASPRSTFAHPQLAETLKTMSAAIVPGASLTVSWAGRPSDAASVLADQSVATALRSALESLARAAIRS